MALTTSKTYYRQQFGPLMPDVYVAPYPYCLHCKVRQAHADGGSWYTVCRYAVLSVSPAISRAPASLSGRLWAGTIMNASSCGHRQNAACPSPSSHPQRSAVFDTPTQPLALQMEPCIPPYRAYHERTCCNGPQEALQWLLKQQVQLHALQDAKVLHLLAQHIVHLSCCLTCLTYIARVCCQLTYTHATLQRTAACLILLQPLLSHAINRACASRSRHRRQQPSLWSPSWGRAAS